MKIIIERHIMRKFSVKVNGKSYEVEIEEIALDATVATTPTTQSAPVAAASAAPAAPAASSAPAGGVEVKAPIQGTVVKVDVAVGDTVAKGARLCVLEAMKMEYDIVAPVDGVIAFVDASRGVAAEAGKILFTIKG